MKQIQTMRCPICDSPSQPGLTKDGCLYFRCEECEFLFHRKEAQSAASSALQFYNREYWEMERVEAMRRENEDSFIRALELIYISTIKVQNILDFGCGLGITVRLLREKLALNAIGIDISADFEETEFLHRCALEALPDKYPAGFFDAIYSIEVFEHLEDPGMVLSLLGRLLKPGGRILINTGTREFISKYDPEQTYIDPTRRGHISIYSHKSLTRLASSIGYEAEFLGDRKYAVILSPAGKPSLWPQADNLERMRKLGEWHPAFMQEYMRLVYLEREFEAKCDWTVRLVAEIESLRARSAISQKGPQRKAEQAWRSIRRRLRK